MSTERDLLATIEALADEWERDYPSLVIAPQLRAALAEARQAVDALDHPHDDQCESEYETGAHAWTPCGCWASRSEAEGLLHRAKAAEAERDAARAKVAESRALPCDGGCVEAPEEDCSRHGRTPADLWRIIDEVRAERDAAREALERVETLAEEWERDSINSHDEPCSDHDDCARCCARDLRAAITQPATDEEAGQ